MCDIKLKNLHLCFFLIYNNIMVSILLSYITLQQFQIQVHRALAGKSLVD